MSELWSTLTVKRKLKAFCKDYSVTELETVVAKLQTEIDSKKADEAAAKQAEAEQLAKVQDALALIEGTGVDASLLIEALKGKGQSAATPKKTRPPKYEYLDPDDNVQTWTGQGRIPKHLESQITDDTPLESFLIKTK